MSKSTWLSGLVVAGAMAWGLGTAAADPIRIGIANFGEHPQLNASIAGFKTGRALLSQQSFEIHELLADGDRAALRATWKGTVGQDVGPYKKGLQMTAHVAAFVTVRDGLVLDHETFDCYEPFPTA